MLTDSGMFISKHSKFPMENFKSTWWVKQRRTFQREDNIRWSNFSGKYKSSMCKNGDVVHICGGLHTVGSEEF